MIPHNNHKVRVGTRYINKFETGKLHFYLRKKMCVVSIFFALIIHANTLKIGAVSNLVGIGIADVTGPAAEVPMMGYGKSSHKTYGIHTRLFSRAFIFKNPRHSADGVVFVSVDIAMIGHLMKKEVIKRLEQDIGPGIYREDNLMLSATHTHSGPGGYMQYVLFSIASWGFVKESFQAIVNGIVNSINQAHNDMKPSTIYFIDGELDGANINRSPTSYLANPEEERLKYKHDTDHTMSQLNIFDANSGNPRGLINWFAVHPTSMNNKNFLISGDNKGVASLMMESHMNKGMVANSGPFVAAFASTNLGDVSPNMGGPHCRKSGLSCSNNWSTCDSESDECVASGPGKDMYESTHIIGEKQFNKSFELLCTPIKDQIEIDGPFNSIYQWIDMTNREVKLDDGSNVKTCKAALGHSFAAGTIDGPGEFDFKQGTITGNQFWNFVRDILSAPSNAEKDCHAPKPILLNTGKMTWPYQWHPDIVDTQLIKLGNVIITAVPGEFTTMAGRRLRDTIRKRVNKISKNKNAKVVIAGLSNIYTHYITTFEEYQEQRYEGASTIYGPHTLLAYQQQYEMLAERLERNEIMEEKGPNPPDLYNKQMSYMTGVVYDSKPWGKKFGDCLLQPPSIVHRGVDTVVVEFQSGHPRNNLRTGKSFIYVEMAQKDDWEVIAVDSDWDTKWEWIRIKHIILGRSKIRVSWKVPVHAKPGVYRIRHVGSYKHGLRLCKIKCIFEYEGHTRLFRVK